MKKILTLALCALTIGGASAQVANIKAAKKLAGKTDKIEEARALAKETIANPETANNPEAYLVAGEIEWKAFDNMRKAAGINPAVADALAMGKLILNGYPYYIKAAELGANDKAGKEAIVKVVSHMNDFFQAGADFFNNKDYVDAYDAFMIYGDLTDVPTLKGAISIPDTVRATSYYNAGLAAYSANELPKAAKAFKAARLNNHPDPSAYVYELATWQNIMQRDTTALDAAREAILDVSQAGIKKFGMTQPVFLNNMVSIFIDEGKNDQALKMVNDVLATEQTPSLYGLRAFVYDRMEKNDESLADYLKAASFPNADFETLKNGCMKLYRYAVEEYNQLDLGTPGAAEKKAKLKETVNQANEMAKRAKSIATDTDNTRQVDYVIENVDYMLDQLK